MLVTNAASAGLAALVLLSFGLAAARTGAQPPSSFQYEFIVACPERADGLPVNQVVCPIRAQDFPQNLLGSPSLALDPSDTKDVLFHAIHDRCAPDGPTIRSRQGTPFTTLTSPDHGGAWYGNYDGPPPSLAGSYG